jgi:very-short-patch-repair endonuclease
VRFRPPRRLSGGQPEARQISGGSRRKSDAVAVNRRKVDAVAARQWGVVSAAQIARRGIDDAVVRRAVRAERLHPLHRGVYSTIPPSLLSVEGWHAAAILAGGTGACLCAESAAWWAKLRKDRPAEIHVAVTGAREPLAGIRWHRLKLRDDERVKLREMPITALERIPLDLAAGLSLRELKSVLAELEYHHGIEPASLISQKGYRGAAKLKKAIADHTPQLAETRSELEQAFIHFLKARGLELPEFNRGVSGTTVDGLYEALGIVIELDGLQGHTGERRVLRDHRRDLHRRADGLLPLRYAYAQLLDPRDSDLIEAELRRHGVASAR